MATFTSVLCALDSSALASRVLRHAVGVAGAFGARLTVLTVTDGDPKPAEARLTTLLHTVIPPGATYAGEPTVQAARRILGSAADAILTEARGGFDLIVIGTHSQGGLRRWLLGSTSRMLLEEARCPVLLVPPGELDIVTLGPDAVRLHPGVVMAAVDPSEHNRRQLSFAGRFAALARQPLLLMTVAPAATSDQAAERVLRELAEEAAAGPVDRVIVRRGAVSAQIDAAAADAHAGLVVMGLQERGPGVPGEIATALLEAKDAVVLAVPAI